MKRERRTWVLEILIVGRCDDLRFNGALEIGDFLRAFVNQKNHRIYFGMVGSHGVGDLLENGCFARAGWGNDQTAGSFADGRNQINDAGFEKIRRGFEVDLFDGINGGEILETDVLGISIERLVVDLLNRAQLRTVATMRRLRFAVNMTTLAQEIALYRVRRDKYVAGFGVVVVLLGAKEAKPLFRDFKKPDPRSFPEEPRSLDAAPGALLIVIVQVQL